VPATDQTTTRPATRRPSAAELAAAAPADRDRFADLVRAASIVVVVAGHWLMAVPAWPPGGRLLGSNALAASPTLPLLTWLLQVMPLFFFVGGYANAKALEGVRRRGDGTAAFLAARMRRLLAPTALFALVWVAVAVVGRLAGPYGDLLGAGARMIAQPLWFLGVYLLVITAAPLMLRAHARFGVKVPVALGVAVVAVDALRLPPGELHGVPFGLGLAGLGMLNFPLVWLLVHQLGFFYADGSLTRLPRAALAAMAGAGLAAMVLLTSSAPYPTSMVGLPGESMSNMNPPSACIVALTFWLVGLAMLARPRLQAWLARPRPWTAVVAANGSIMTVYLWHLTAMVAAILVLYPAGFPSPAPGSAAWWATRPLWLAACAGALAVLVRLLGRFERPPAARVEASSTRLCTAVAVAGCLALAVGLVGVAGAGLDLLGPSKVASVLGLAMDQRAAAACCLAGALALTAVVRRRR
jgi:Acyltransferase family